jgi:hypothetical protein
LGLVPFYANPNVILYLRKFQSDAWNGSSVVERGAAAAGDDTVQTILQVMLVVVVTGPSDLPRTIATYCAIAARDRPCPME